MSLLDNVISNKANDDKRYRVNIAVIKQALEEEEVDEIRWIDGSDMLADVLTKAGAIKKKLKNVMETGRRFPKDV